MFVTKKQEVLRRTSRLLSFDTIWAAQKTMLPKILRCLATRGGYTDRPRDTRIQQLYFCLYSLPWERVYRVVAKQ
jgi:hypothetical protein